MTYVLIRGVRDLKDDIDNPHILAVSFENSPLENLWA